MEHTEFSSKVDDQGRVVLPAALRKAMHITPGVEVLIRFDGRAATIETRQQRIRAVQDRLRARLGKRSAVDEFLAERKEAASAE